MQWSSYLTRLESKLGNSTGSTHPVGSERYVRALPGLRPDEPLPHSAGRGGGIVCARDTRIAEVDLILINEQLLSLAPRRKR
jgi:hypothetical protein